MNDTAVRVGELDRKFELEDMTPELISFASEYAAAYVGDFDFMVDMNLAIRHRGGLTAGQAKGTLNCYRAEVLRRLKKTPAAGAVEDGMYLDPETGDVFKVQYAVHGSGNLYAKKLERDENDAWHFHYDAGAVRRLRPEWRMTLEQAKAFGALYGTCCVCGRTLTREESIEAGIGPVCAGKF